MTICWMNFVVIPKTPQLTSMGSFRFLWKLLWISLFFHEGQSRSSSRVRGYVINAQNTLMPYIFWKPWMSPTGMSGLFFHISNVKFWLISTYMLFWITVCTVYRDWVLCTVIQAVEISQNFKIETWKKRPDIPVGDIQGFQKMYGMSVFRAFMT